MLRKRIKIFQADYHVYTSLLQKIPRFSAIVYVDPPYEDVKTRSNLTKYFTHFDNDEFWKTMRIWSQYQLVFISEYCAPPDFVEIWSHSFKSHNSFIPYYRTEKLFIHKHLKEVLQELKEMSLQTPPLKQTTLLKGNTKEETQS
jgi:hypothetical protein